MVEIVNLRRARKAKERAEKEKTAEANRVLHGTPKHLRRRSEAEKAKAEQRLAGIGWKKIKTINRWDFASPRSKIVLMFPDSRLSS